MSQSPDHPSNDGGGKDGNGNSHIELTMRENSGLSKFQVADTSSTAYPLSTVHNGSGVTEQTSAMSNLYGFYISAAELSMLVNKYVTRKRAEDVEAMQKYGGLQGFEQLLSTNLHKGIDVQDAGCSSPEIVRRKKHFGTNVLPRRPPTAFYMLVMDAASDFTLRVLMLCGMVSIALGATLGERKDIEWIEGFVIWLAVVIVILVTAGNDYMKERQFAQLSDVKDEKDCTVIRGGKKHKISVKDLVVGDILYVEAGDELPGDCLVVHQRGLLVDESSLTGESDHLAKTCYEDSWTELQEKADALAAAPEEGAHHIVHSPVALSGTTVTSGSANVLVISVGEASQLGQMFQKLAFDADPTPLQNKLNAIARDIGKLGLICAVMTFLVLVFQYWIMYSLLPENERPNGAAIAIDHVDFIVIAITILVVAIPEGLPLAVTMSLAYSIGRMLKDQNYVRRLAACETMGGADEICSDKTGTLTRNKMTVQAFWNCIDLSTEIDTAKSTANFPRLSDKEMPLLMDCINLNSTAFLEIEHTNISVGGPANIKEVVKHVGSPTECAMLELARHMGYNYETRRNECEELIIHQVPFSSARKIMSTVLQVDDKYRVFVKGAAEKVLRLCNKRLNSFGGTEDLDKLQTGKIEQTVVHQFATQALRTICLAYRDLDTMPDFEDVDPVTGCRKHESGLCCLGVVGIRDPVRDEVPPAVLACQRAGIKVRMVTGDNIETAKQIGIRCNIYKPEAGGLAMLGPEFYKAIGGIVCEHCRTEKCGCAQNEKSAKDGSKKVRVDVLGNMKRFTQIAPDLQVLARSQPNDKYALVTGLKALGSIVAVTGDGTNDAPALKKADVGFAMGLAGTEVAKQASDIVLLDDNFQSIVQAVKWGRNIYDNIRRFLQFQLTINIVAVTGTFIAAVVLRETPIKAVQMLWVNLIMDVLASLALATELPTEKLLDRKPCSRDSYLISRTMFRNILGQGIYQLTVLMMTLFYADAFVPEERWWYVTDEQRRDHPGFCEFSDCASGPEFGTTMRSGRRYHPFSIEGDYEHAWSVGIGPSRHYTFVFNSFVWMQIFNMINARKIDNELNVFAGILKNKAWFLVMLLIVSAQTFFVQFGSFPLDCHLTGLTMQQWGICVLIGSGSLVVPLILRLLPLKVLPEAGHKEVNPLHESKSIAMISRGRMSSDRIYSRIHGGRAGPPPRSALDHDLNRNHPPLEPLDEREEKHSFSRGPSNFRDYMTSC